MSMSCDNSSNQVSYHFVIKTNNESPKYQNLSILNPSMLKECRNDCVSQQHNTIYFPGIVS